MSPAQRILIVDDDPGTRDWLAAALDAPDRAIETASDGLAGLCCVEAAPYDLIIAGMNLPGFDGPALIERIHKVRPDAKVAMVASASTPENIVRALRERAFMCISKPFKPAMVGQLVEYALTSARWQDDIEVLSARPQWLSLRVRCKLETADRILQFLGQMDMDLPAAERRNIGIAFREILLNAIEHGAGNDPEKTVAITYLRTERALLYYVRDPGKGFSFHNLEHAAVFDPERSPFEQAEVRERLGMRPGGFGLLITRQLMDEMLFNEAGNEVLLIKYLG